MAQVITGNVVSYIRTSTDRQRRSGLGIEAQRAVARFAESEGLTVIAEYVETETGKGADASIVGPSSRRPCNGSVK